MDTKEQFRDYFEHCCDLLLERFPNKKELEREIIGTIVIRFLKDLTMDIEKMNFIELYQKYLRETLFLDCDDFTNSQKEEIIKESSLTDRDRKMALMYFNSDMSEEDIANELMVDKKTIRNNIPRISMVLKQTASKIYKRKMD